MIILTGASGGIGQEIINGLSNIDNLIGIYNKNKLLTKKKINYHKVDLTSENNINKFIKTVEKKLNKITLIHCAAKKIDDLLINFKQEHFKKIIDVNLLGNFLLTKHLLPIMLKNKWGRIIHISSVTGKIGAVGTIPYGLSKTALYGFSRGLAKEYAKFNITSNIIELGYFKTGLYKNLSKNVQNELLMQIPSKKLGNVDNIVNCINFLINSDYVNGSKISIDGGI